VVRGIVAGHCYRRSRLRRAVPRRARSGAAGGEHGDLRAAAEPESVEGMATTLCTAGLAHDVRLVVANLGDSRAALVRGGALQQLTEDYSVTAAMVRRGEITEEDAPHHPHRSVLTRAVGVGPTVDVGPFVQPVGPGDGVLLRTNGM
jgi:PPM family protein phosphatase